jgi:hypothetical protein
MTDEATYTFAFGDDPFATEIDSDTFAAMSEVELAAIAAAHDIAIDQLRVSQLSVRIEIAFAHGGEAAADAVYRPAVDRYGPRAACRALEEWQQRGRMILEHLTRSSTPHEP